MSILVRRINRAKWEQILNEKDPLDSSADAITNCLKTSNNDLSVWKINDLSNLDDAILALITGPQQTKLSTIHYILINEEALLKEEFKVVETDGDTTIDSLKKMHRDISELTYKKLGIIKDLILYSLQNNEETILTKSKLRELLKNAISAGKVKKESLNEELVKNEKL